MVSTPLHRESLKRGFSFMRRKNAREPPGKAIIPKGERRKKFLLEEKKKFWGRKPDPH